MTNVVHAAFLTMTTAKDGDPIGMSKSEALGFLSELEQNICRRIAQMRRVLYHVEDDGVDFVEYSAALLDELRRSIKEEDRS